jgi:DNA-binding HxlR family transcriptional regulator
MIAIATDPLTDAQAAAEAAQVVAAPARAAVLLALADAPRPLRAPELARDAGGLSPGTTIGALRVLGLRGFVESHPRARGLGRMYQLTAAGRKLAVAARGLVP